MRRWERAVARLRAVEEALEGAAEDEGLYDRLGSRHDVALLRVLRMPAPDLGALAEKIALLIEQQAWEFAEGDLCLASVLGDARRFATASG